jgi:hypothetical protein
VGPGQGARNATCRSNDIGGEADKQWVPAPALIRAVSRKRAPASHDHLHDFGVTPLAQLLVSKHFLIVGTTWRGQREGFLATSSTPESSKKGPPALLHWAYGCAKALRCSPIAASWSEIEVRARYLVTTWRFANGWSQHEFKVAANPEAHRLVQRRR